MKKILTILLLTLLYFVAGAQTQFTYSGNASGTDTYTTSITNLTSYGTTRGVVVDVKFTNASTGAATLNINSLGAIDIAGVVAGTIPANSIKHLAYNIVSGDFDIIGGTGGGSSITLTTTGTSGAASLIGSVLNVPQYSGGGGGGTWGSITGTLSSQTDLNTSLGLNLKIGSNLSDLNSAPAARTNLGLGTLATQSGTFSGTSSNTNTGDQTNISGNAGTVTTNANLTGTVTSIGNATAIANGAITNSMLTNTAVANLSGTNTGDQTITLTGDITGSGTGSFATTLSSTAVTPGSYTSTNLTVDAKGRITAASNGSAGSGTVTDVSITTVNGVSGSVATSTTTPAISLTLGAITPTSTNGVSAATMAFNDATSSIQTQINSKGSGTVTGVTGTANQITVTGTTTPVISLPATITGLTSVSSTGFTGALTGNATTVTTNANLTGAVTSSGNATSTWYVTPEQFGAVGNGATNDQAALQLCVDATKPCMLQNKNYFTSTSVVLTDNETLLGSSSFSTISTTANIFVLSLQGSNITIRDLTLRGSDSGAAQDLINSTGNAGFTSYRINNRIINVDLFDAGRSGIYSTNIIGSLSGTKHEGGIFCDNVRASSGARGFYMDTRAEYNSFSNCRADNNTSAAVHFNGGNNNWTGGAVTDNTVGVLIGSGANDGHAQMVGTKINHNATNVQATSTATGYLFDACYLYAGNIIFSSSTGIKFYNCEFSTLSITSTTSTGTEFKNCIFQTTPTISVSGTQPKWWNNTVTTGVYTNMFGVLGETSLASAHIKGSGTTNTTAGIRHENSSGTILWRALDNGSTLWGSNGTAPQIYPVQNTTTIANAGSGLGYGSSSLDYGHYFFNSAVNAAGILNLTSNFVQSSGVLSHTGLLIRPTINTTGSYVGSSYGLYYDPILTSTTGNTLNGLISVPVNSVSGFATSTPNSTLHTAGSFAAGYVAKSSAYTAGLNDYAIECTSGTFTVTLPTAIGIPGRMYVISNSGAGTITIGTTLSQTFKNVTGTPTTLSKAIVGAITVMSNGSEWLKISEL